jgi:hypothetical protein
MPNNLHISYDLKNPGRDYEKVISAVKQMGNWAKIQYSYWYVDSHMSAEQARAYLVKFIDSNDTIYIVDATNNNAAWHNISDEAGIYIRDRWLAKAA